MLGISRVSSVWVPATAGSDGTHRERVVAEALQPPVVHVADHVVVGADRRDRERDAEGDRQQQRDREQTPVSRRGGPGRRLGRRRDQQPAQQQPVDDAGHRREREEQRRAERSLGDGEGDEGGERWRRRRGESEAQQRIHMSVIFATEALAAVLL